MSDIGTLTINLAGNATSLRRVLYYSARDLNKFSQQVDRTADKTGDALEQINGKVMALSAAVTMGFGAATMAFAKFDDAMRGSLAMLNLGTTKVSNSMVRTMSQTAIDLSKVSRQSATEIAEIYYGLISAGYDAQQSMKALSVVENFAMVSGMKTAKATETLKDAMFSLGLTSDDAAVNMKNMARVADVITYTAAQSSATVEELAKALASKAGPAARTFGMDVEQTTAVLGAFANAGVKGKQASTWFSMMYRDLAQSFQKKSGMWKAVGIELFDKGKMRNTAAILEDLSKLFARLTDNQKKAMLSSLGFNTRTEHSTLALMDNFEMVRKLEAGAKKNAAGSVNKIKDPWMTSMMSQFKMLANNFNAIFLEFGTRGGFDFMLTIMEKANIVLKDISSILKNGIADSFIGIATSVALFVGGLKTAMFFLTGINAISTSIKDRLFLGGWFGKPGGTGGGGGGGVTQGVSGPVQTSTPFPPALPYPGTLSATKGASAVMAAAQKKQAAKFFNYTNANVPASTIEPIQKTLGMNSVLSGRFAEMAHKERDYYKQLKGLQGKNKEKSSLYKNNALLKEDLRRRASHLNWAKETSSNTLGRTLFGFTGAGSFRVDDTLGGFKKNAMSMMSNNGSMGRTLWSSGGEVLPGVGGVSSKKVSPISSFASIQAIIKQIQENQKDARSAKNRAGLPGMVTGALSSYYENQYKLLKDKLLQQVAAEKSNRAAQLKWAKTGSITQFEGGLRGYSLKNGGYILDGNQQDVRASRLAQFQANQAQNVIPAKPNWGGIVKGALVGAAAGGTVAGPIGAGIGALTGGAMGSKTFQTAFKTSVESFKNSCAGFKSTIMSFANAPGGKLSAIGGGIMGVMGALVSPIMIGAMINEMLLKPFGIGLEDISKKIIDWAFGLKIGVDAEKQLQAGTDKINEGAKAESSILDMIAKTKGVEEAKQYMEYLRQKKDSSNLDFSGGEFATNNEQATMFGAMSSSAIEEYLKKVKEDFDTNAGPAARAESIKKSLESRKSTAGMKDFFDLTPGFQVSVEETYNKMKEIKDLAGVNGITLFNKASVEEAKIRETFESVVKFDKEFTRIKESKSGAGYGFKYSDALAYEKAVRTSMAQDESVQPYVQPGIDMLNTLDFENGPAYLSQEQLTKMEDGVKAMKELGQRKLDVPRNTMDSFNKMGIEATKNTINLKEKLSTLRDEIANVGNTAEETFSNQYASALKKVANANADVQSYQATHTSKASEGGLNILIEQAMKAEEELLKLKRTLKDTYAALFVEGQRIFDNNAMATMTAGDAGAYKVKRMQANIDAVKGNDPADVARRQKLINERKIEVSNQLAPAKGMLTANFNPASGTYQNALQTQIQSLVDGMRPLTATELDKRAGAANPGMLMAKFDIAKNNGDKEAMLSMIPDLIARTKAEMDLTAQAGQMRNDKYRAAGQYESNKAVNLFGSEGSTRSMFGRDVKANYDKDIEKNTAKTAKQLEWIAKKFTNTVGPIDINSF